tara:strand:+ start:183 stop:983 length:801 start_codon:yes stop_codon:yes gene_type:complete
MHKNTPNIKEQINSKYDESYDRVKHLKDQYKGETAYILASGPSFKEIPQDILQEKLKDKLTISIKQTFDSIPNIVDYHLLNFCNLTKYTYPNPNTIVGWTVWDNNQPNVIAQNFPVDFILDTFKLNDGAPNIENSLAFNLKQIDLLDMNTNLSRPWGPGTMYEIAMPLALYLGCTKIVTIGWDLFGSSVDRYKDDKEALTQPHCYDNNSLIFKETDTAITKKEIIGTINSTKSIYEWLKSKEIDLEIVDPYGNNPAYEKIKRIKTI